MVHFGRAPRKTVTYEQCKRHKRTRKHFRVRKSVKSCWCQSVVLITIVLPTPSRLDALVKVPALASRRRVYAFFPARLASRTLSGCRRDASVSILESVSALATIVRTGGAHARCDGFEGSQGSRRTRLQAEGATHALAGSALTSPRERVNFP